MKIWVSEMSERTCDFCASLHGLMIRDYDEFSDFAGCEPGDAHDRCQCFEWYEPDAEIPIEDYREIQNDLVTPRPPQGLTPAGYGALAGIGAILLYWPEEDTGEPRMVPPGYYQDDYDHLVDNAEVW